MIKGKWYGEGGVLVLGEMYDIHYLLRNRIEARFLVIGVVRHFIKQPDFYKNVKIKAGGKFAVVDLIGIRMKINEETKNFDTRGVGVFYVPSALEQRHLEAQAKGTRLAVAFGESQGYFRLKKPDNETILGLKMYKKKMNNREFWAGEAVRTYNINSLPYYLEKVVELEASNWDFGYEYTGDVDLASLYTEGKYVVRAKADPVTVTQNFNEGVREPVISNALVDSEPSIPLLSEYSTKRVEVVEGLLSESVQKKEDYLRGVYEGDLSGIELNSFLIKIMQNTEANWNDPTKGSDLFVKVMNRIFDGKYPEGFFEGLVESLGVEAFLGFYTRYDFYIKDHSVVASIFASDFLNLYATRELYLVGLYEVILGVRGLVDSYFASDQSTDFVKMMLYKPYNLIHLDSGIQKEVLDRLAVVAGLDLEDKKVFAERAVALMYGYIMTKDSTLLKRQELVGLNLNREYSARERKVLSNQAFGRVETEITIGVLFDIIYKGTVEGYEFYKRFEIKELAQVGVNPTEVIADLVEVGLVCIYEGHVIATTYLEKELYIYNRLYNMAVVTEEVTGIEEKIQEFEMMKAEELGIDKFVLESRQRDCFGLVKFGASCVTGPAGSGKTTTAEGIVYCFETLLGIPRNEIYFVAPTAKAAKRLKESVKRPTSTIHRLFKLGKSLVGGNNLEATGVDKSGIPKISLLVVDESAMVDINLMYSMLTRYTGDKIMFLGDIEQLPAIGAGKVFGDLLGILPTVRLNVSKRASDKSLITLNSKELCTSDKKFMTGNDFKIIECMEHETSTIIKEICDYHIHGVGTSYDVSDVVGRVDYRDIQVMSPINGRDWGVEVLNAELAPIFNDRKSKQMYIRQVFGKMREFRLGDRVIHTVNESQTKRYDYLAEGEYSLSSELGVMNGDTGYVVGIHLAKDLRVNDEVYNYNASVGVLEVMYEDINELGDVEYFRIFYDFDIRKTINNCIEVSGLSFNISLAYALTVHKMQGSQAKVIIFALHPAGRGNSFISRNLVYTAITRAEDLVYVVGNRELLENSRYNEVSGTRRTLLGLLG